MKNIFKKISCILLITAMLVTAFPLSAFAGGDDEPEIDHTEYSSAYDTSNSASKGPNSSFSNGDTSTYILQVTMDNGTSGGDCRYVIIKYYASEAAKTNNVISTQMLDIEKNDYISEEPPVLAADADATAREQYIAGVESYMKTWSNSYDFTSNRASLYNSKELSYGLLFSNTYFTCKNRTVKKDFGKYYTLANEIITIPDKYRFKSVQEKIFDTAFNGGNSDYIRFRFEYGFYELVEMDFYCPSDEGVSSLPISYWALYRHEGEFNGDSFNTTTTRLENFAFVSDSLGMSFNGTKLYESILKTEDMPANVYHNTDLDAVGMGRSGANVLVFMNEEAIEQGGDMTFATAEQAFFFRACEEGTQNTVSVNDRRVLNFSIQLDSYLNAGIEQYYTDARGGFTKYKECLYAEIEYKDANGYRQYVSLPVITNALLEYIVPVDENMSDATAEERLKKVKEGSYVSFAADGETINFSVEFPSFSSLEALTLTYDAFGQDDFVTIDYIAVYDNAGETRYARRDLYTNNSVDDAAIDTTLRSAEMLYITTDDLYGYSLNYRTNKIEYDFESVNPEDVKDTTKYLYEDGLYLVTVKTATNDAGICGTGSRIGAIFSYYDNTGSEKLKKTVEYDLASAANDFYGGNPATIEVQTAQLYSDGSYKKDSNGNIMYDTETKTSDDAAYYHGMSEGNTLKFYVNISNASRLAGVQFRLLDDLSEDEWGLEALTIQKVADGSVESRRFVRKVSEKAVISRANGQIQTAYINRVYEKTITGLTNVYRNNDINLMVLKDEPLVISFEDTYIESEDEDSDLSQYKYSMTQDQSAQDLGINKTRATFTVRVHVGKNSVNATRDDDCGSNNLFYFQLVFKSTGATHANSGYVLANQQLTADGFRAGHEEEFTINCNEDVGDVIAVNIIPDNQTDDAQTLDKLYIEKIEVFRSKKGNVDKRFVCEDVGWVKHEFEDDDSNTEQVGKTANELVHTASVTTTGYVMNLEFKFGIGDYPSGGKRYCGNLKMSLKYEDADTTEHILDDIQVVKAICEYMGKTPVVSDTLGGYTSEGTDLEWMFKANSVANFVVPISDMCTLKSMSLYGYPYSSTEANQLNITSIRVKCIITKGSWTMGTDMERKAEKDFLICDTVANQGVGLKTFPAVAEGASPRPISFNFVNVQVLPQIEEEKKLLSMVSRTPQSVNDTLNLYIYMNPAMKTQDEGGYKLTSHIYYNSVIGDVDYDVKVNSSDFHCTYETIDGERYPVMYATGLSGSMFLSLQNLTLAAPESYGGEKLYASHAIIQQVRDGVIINTYKIVFGGTIINLTKGGLSALGKYPQSELGYKQVVSMQLGAETSKANLVAECYDIACAIRYTSKAVGDNKVYKSAYKFITDDDVTNIHAGSIVDFEFDEAYVDEIVGIDVACVNTFASEDLVASFQCANVKTYETDAKDELKQVDIVSITQTAQLGSSATSLDVDSAGPGLKKELRKADLTFTTSEIIDVVDSGGNAPIRMKLWYTNPNSLAGLECVDIPDIRNYVVDDDSGFAAGQSVTVSVFLENAKKLRYVEIEPYYEVSSDSAIESKAIASWNLGSIEFSLEGAEDPTPHKVTVEQTIYQDNQRMQINLSQISVKLGIKNGDVDAGTVINGETYITSDIGGKITITPTIYDSTQGYRVKIYREIGKAKATIESFAKDSGSFTFETSNDTNSEVTWIIEVSSAESSAVKSTVYVTVPPDESGTGSVKVVDVEKVNAEEETASGSALGENTSGSALGE